MERAPHRQYPVAMSTLRTLRKARKLTLEDVAAGVGTTAGHLSKIERGVTAPSLDLLRDLAAYFGQTPSSVLAEPQGMAEPDLLPFEPPAPGSNVPDLRALAPHARSPVLLRLSRAQQGFGLPAGAVLVIDTHAAPESGALAVLRVADPETGEAETRLARIAGPVALAHDFATNPQAVYRLDDPDTALYGMVAAFAVAPQLDAPAPQKALPAPAA